MEMEVDKSCNWMQYLTLLFHAHPHLEITLRVCE